MRRNRIELCSRCGLPPRKVGHIQRVHYPGMGRQRLCFPCRREVRIGMKANLLNKGAYLALRPRAWRPLRV